MNHNYFVMHQRKRSVLGWALCTLLSGSIVTGMALNWLDHTDESPHGDLIFIGIFILFSLMAIGNIAMMVNAVIWKCTIQGEHIHYRSLFYRKEFAFHDIERVAFHHVPATTRSFEINAWHIFLSKKKRPLTVPTKGIGIHIFLECLRNRNISVERAK